MDNKQKVDVILNIIKNSGKGIMPGKILRNHSAILIEHDINSDQLINILDYLISTNHIIQHKQYGYRYLGMQDLKIDPININSDTYNVSESIFNYGHIVGDVSNTIKESESKKALLLFFKEKWIETTLIIGTNTINWALTYHWEFVKNLFHR